MLLVYSISGPDMADAGDDWYPIDLFPENGPDGIALHYRAQYSFKHIWQLEYDTSAFDKDDKEHYCPEKQQVKTKFHLEV